MAGITLEQAQAQLDAWLAASIAVASNQAYEISTGTGTRRLTRANAEHIDRMIKFWEQRVLALTPAAAGGRRRTHYVVPQ